MLIKEFPHLKEWEGKIEKRGEKRKIKALMLTCNKRKYYLYGKIKFKIKK